MKKSDRDIMEILEAYDPSWANLVRIAAVDVGERVAEVVG